MINSNYIHSESKMLEESICTVPGQVPRPRERVVVDICF